MCVPVCLCVCVCLCVSVCMWVWTVGRPVRGDWRLLPPDRRVRRVLDVDRGDRPGAAREDGRRRQRTRGDKDVSSGEGRGGGAQGDANLPSGGMGSRRRW